MNNNEALLVNEYRGGLLECAHYGHICIIDEQARIAGRAGNPHATVFTRSSAKPIQALPGIRAGIIGAYGLTDEEIAIMTASHRAEEVHVGTLESLLSKTGLAEERLVCAPSLPLDETAKERLLRQGGAHRRIYHNCSGKHLGVLAYCKMMGYPLDSYNHPDHPVQREILATLAGLAGIPEAQISLGTDGCGFPVFALPLSALATAYLKLACPDLIGDTATAEAAKVITEAMNRHPLLVAGTGRIDSILLSDPNIVAKGGFKGVYAFALRRERVGVTFKIQDGSEEEWGMIALSVLEQLGYENEETLRKLREAFPSSILNDEGWQVGQAETVFRLEP
ncbi:L-asparaginase II [compost metagenome]|uniref:asparaginase n=1 Tax=Paenibacillus sp. FSL R7-0216 TaxID=2921677 RepID=UPI000FA9FFE3|nr:asparaginase [Paenibacillus timonensis]MUG88191.1 asparaginase [Paenibacillus timonensis]